MHKTTDRFWECFEELPEEIKNIARRSLELLKSNPSHPSLHFKKVGSLWSVRAGYHYRTLAIKRENDYVWIWIGTNEEYEKLIN
jgi:hypothetical protein